jgi:transposase InsO family protein
MQIRHLQRPLYRAARLASRLEAEERSDVAERRDAVARWQQARRQGLTAEAAAQAVGEKRATLYRWAKRISRKSTRPHTLRKTKPDPKLAAAVERLRKKHPMWGKDKLAPLLWKEGFECSVSMVGRILTKLVERGVVQPVPALRKGSKHAPRKHKRVYAVRLPKKLKPEKPGQIVQLDTVHIALAPGKTIRHFTGYCPVAKWTVAKAYNRATAASATMFLDKLKDDLPFKLEAIQVDGGSEFMAGFEQACKERDIKLYVLPPRTPQLNGGVERCNGAWRYEFYATTDLPGTVEELNPLIDDWQDTYNFVRPHRALSGLTPAEYLTRPPTPESPQPSQMS